MWPLLCGGGSVWPRCVPGRSGRVSASQVPAPADPAPGAPRQAHGEGPAHSRVLGTHSSRGFRASRNGLRGPPAAADALLAVTLSRRPDTPSGLASAASGTSPGETERGLPGPRSEVCCASEPPVPCSGRQVTRLLGVPAQRVGAAPTGCRDGRGRAGSGHRAAAAVNFYGPDSPGGATIPVARMPQGCREWPVSRLQPVARVQPAEPASSSPRGAD